MKNLFKIFMLLLTLNSFAVELAPGSFFGKTSNRDEYCFLVKPVPGREGSFYGVLFKTNGGKKIIQIYLMDPVGSGSGEYAMVPFQVTDRNIIGIVDDDPSITLTVQAVEKGKYWMYITNAKSDNKRGFNGNIIFEGKTTKWSWGSLKEGRYRYKSSKKKFIVVSSYNVAAQEAKGFIQGINSSLDGKYVLEQDQLDMFTLKDQSTLAVGTVKKETPRMIGIFINDYRGKERMYLVDPQDETRFIEFKE